VGGDTGWQWWWLSGWTWCEGVGRRHWHTRCDVLLVLVCGFNNLCVLEFTDKDTAHVMVQVLGFGLVVARGWCGWC
jgi:hypothetical protein